MARRLQDDGQPQRESCADSQPQSRDRSADPGVRADALAAALEGPGYFFVPGIVTNVPREAPLYNEEVFGPVAAIFRARGIEEAIEIANDTRYGLGSSVWTEDARERERCVRDLDAGSTFINAMVESDPRAPFGGVKASGYGRELARDGILEFVNRKTVRVA